MEKVKLVNRGFLVLFFCLYIGQLFGQTKKPYALPEHVSVQDYSDEMIIVRFQEGYSVKSARNRFTGRSGQRELRPAIQHISTTETTTGRTAAHPLSSIYKVTLKTGEDPIVVVNEYLQREDVLYAEPYFKHKPLIVPNDPEASLSGGRQDYLEVINAYDAWSVERGDTSVVIGILDTGAEIMHSDLTNNIAYNYNDPVNGVDDDGDGLVDNFAGWDIADNDNNVAADADSHGTRVAGTSSASTNNGLGIAGAGYNSRFLPIKVFSSFGNFFSDGYSAILLAADLGCKVVNLSWRTSGAFSQFAQDVINYVVLEKNVVVVAAAGNSNVLENTFPASYDNVLSVAATTVNDERAPFSSFGYNVDMTAPGVNIFSTNNFNSYGNISGTSFSSPLVAGTAALIMARFPNLTAQQVMERLRVTSDDIYSVGSNMAFDGLLGKGRLNMLEALTNNFSPSVRIQDFNYDNGTGPYAFYGDTLTLNVRFQNFLSPTFNATATISSASPYVQVLASTANLGAIPTMSETNNFSQPFRILLSDDLPNNEVIVLRVDFEDGFYRDFQHITITSTPEYITFDNNHLQLTLDSDGDLGYSKEFLIGGIGFSQGDVDLLDNIGLITAIHPDTVLDNAPTNLVLGTKSKDFIQNKRIRFYNNSVADKDARLTFMDRPENDNSLGLNIDQKTLAWDSSSFIIQEYRVSNTGTATLNDLHLALFADWNLNNQNFNRADWHDPLKLGYVFDALSDTLYTGIALLTSQTPIQYAINNKNFNGNATDIPTLLNDSVKFSLVSQGIGKETAGTNNTGNDVSQITGGTITQLATNQSEKLAFALVSGNSLADLISAVNEAQLHYNEYLSSPPLLEVFFACSGEQAIVNPSNGETFEFYNDVALTDLEFTGPEFTSPILTNDIVYYAVNKDKSFDGDIVRVIARPKLVHADFSTDSSPLLLDETGENSVQITDRSIDPVAWEWNFSHGFQSNVQHPLISYTDKGSYGIEVTVTNDLGCTETISKSLEVDYRSNLPDLDDFMICKGENIRFDPANATNIEVYSDGDLQHQIFSGTEYISGLIFKDTIFYVISLDSTYASNVKNVEVEISDVKADFIHRPDTSDLTNPHIIQLENRSLNNALFFWVVNDELLKVNADATYAYDINTPFELKLIAEDINGCFDERIEIVTPSAAAKPASMTTELCVEGSAVYTAMESNFFNFYADASANQLIGKGSIFSLEDISKDTMIYFTDNQLYGESEIGSFQVGVSNVKSMFSLPAKELNLAAANHVTVSNESEDASIFTWRVNDVQVSTEPSPILAFSEPGEYLVELIGSNEAGCESRFSQSLRVVSITSTDVLSEGVITFYPNPVTNLLTVTAEQPSTFTIYNTQGKRMPLIKVSNQTLNLSSLSPGIYVLEIRHGNDMTRQKIVKK
ncbi:S8 family serine peptidase [Fulvivirga sp. M361]|uniref:S8 family serine peptidase n=1 Tax=Fulvivirga sp. M361 TaxID=2594266 RepID=UPI00117BBD73|nr:S8 family serine peptidase [Fulvivirga sp. M361]TRX58256.1 S8 family serine peptidase [Fulvivirga sp. M361]